MYGRGGFGQHFSLLAEVVDPSEVEGGIARRLELPGDLREDTWHGRGQEAREDSGRTRPMR